MRFEGFYVPPNLSAYMDSTFPFKDPNRIKWPLTNSTQLDLCVFLILILYSEC